MKPMNPDVNRVLATYPADIRPRILALRELIFATAAATEGVGELEETLKWGEPAYVTAASGSGSTIRIGWKVTHPSRCAIYFNCNTTLVDTFRTLFPNDFEFEGNRAIIFDASADVPTESLAFCIAAALTYHRAKPRRRSR